MGRLRRFDPVELQPAAETQEPAPALPPVPAPMPNATLVVDPMQLERKIAAEIASMPPVSPGVRLDRVEPVATDLAPRAAAVKRPYDRLGLAEHQAAQLRRTNSAMRDAGIKSTRELHGMLAFADHTIGKPEMIALLRGRRSPLAASGDFTSLAFAISTVLNQTPEKLFGIDPRRLDRAGKSTRPVPGIDVTTPERHAMDREAAQALIRAISAIQQPSDRDVITRRLAGDTLEEIAQAHGYAAGAGKERMRQREARALYTLKLKSSGLQGHSAPTNL